MKETMEANAAESETTTTKLKYALSDGMARAAKVNRTGRYAGIVMVIALVVMFLPVSLMQQGSYEHLFNGRNFPSLMLSYAITAVASIVLFSVVNFAFKYAEKVSGRKLQSDPLTKRIAADFHVPEKVVAESLAAVAGRIYSSTHFAHDGIFHTVKYRAKYDEQIENYVSYVNVSAAPVQGVASELIVP